MWLPKRSISFFLHVTTSKSPHSVIRTSYWKLSSSGYKLQRAPLTPAHRCMNNFIVSVRNTRVLGFQRQPTFHYWSMRPWLILCSGRGVARCSVTALAVLQIILLNHLPPLLSDSSGQLAWRTHRTTMSLDGGQGRYRAPLNPSQPSHQPRMKMIQTCMINLNVFVNVCSKI